MKLSSTKFHQSILAWTKVPGLNGALFYDLNQLRCATSKLLTRVFSLYPVTCPVVTQWIMKWKLKWFLHLRMPFNAVKQRSLENAALQETFSGFLRCQQLRGSFSTLLHSCSSSIIHFHICWVLIWACTLFLLYSSQRSLIMHCFCPSITMVSRRLGAIHMICCTLDVTIRNRQHW